MQGLFALPGFPVPFAAPGWPHGLPPAPGAEALGGGGFEGSPILKLKGLPFAATEDDVRFFFAGALRARPPRRFRHGRASCVQRSAPPEVVCARRQPSADTHARGRAQASRCLRRRFTTALTGDPLAWCAASRRVRIQRPRRAPAAAARR
jgi:hypothetical protein